MKILISDTDQSHAETCEAKILAECPTAITTIRLGSLSGHISWAIQNMYDIISRSTTGLSDSRNENEGDTAWAGVRSGAFNNAFDKSFDIDHYPVGIVHALGSNSHVLDTDPSRLDVISAVSAGDGAGNCDASYGDGLEYFHDGETTQSYATARIAGIIGQLMIDHPTWTFQDARAALRQTSSKYNTGWIQDGGYGYVDKTLATAVTDLALFSPIRKTFSQDSENKTIDFTWENALQSGAEKTVIARFYGLPDRDAVPDVILYEGTDTEYQHDYSEAFRASFYYAFLTQGSYSLIESFDSEEIDTGSMSEIISLTSGIEKKISLTSALNLEVI